LCLYPIEEKDYEEKKLDKEKMVGERPWFTRTKKQMMKPNQVTPSFIKVPHHIIKEDETHNKKIPDIFKKHPFNVPFAEALK